MSADPSLQITVSLPSLVHRVGRDAVNSAREMAQTYQCDIKRIRRSRNWQLLGTPQNIQKLHHELVELNGELASYWNKRIEPVLLQHQAALVPIEVQLRQRLEADPSLTLSELMDQTKCTIAQAREARMRIDEW